MEHSIKLLTILGSTGSIGENALRVVRAHPDRFQLVGLSAYSNAERLIEQAKEFHPKAVCIASEDYRDKVTSGLAGTGIKIFSGRSGLLELASMDDATLLLNALVGTSGLEPSVRAIESGIPG